jgi:ankyrin repeat protein
MPSNIFQTKDRPIHAACIGGHLDVLEALIRKFVDVNATLEGGSAGTTPLMIAAKAGFADVVKLLLDSKANLAATKPLVSSRQSSLNKCFMILFSKNGASALFEACDANETATAKLLLQYGANPNIKYTANNGAEETVLHIATANNNLELVQEILLYRGDPDEGNEEKETPLHIAAARGFLPIVHVLVNDYHANINAINKVNENSSA